MTRTLEFSTQATEDLVTQACVTHQISMVLLSIAESCATMVFAASAGLGCGDGLQANPNALSSKMPKTYRSFMPQINGNS